MAVVYHEIYLPIDTESTFDYIVIKQGDAGTHRVRATLISNNRVYTIPTSGASYFMKFRKPDNNYCLVEATVSDNTISAEVTEEMLRVSGTGRGEFMIVSGSQELKTATFHVKIVKETYTSGDVQSHSDFAPFAALLQGAGAAASNANTAAAAANAAASLAEQKAQAIPDDYSDLVAEVAGKADKSTTYTKAQVDQMISDVEVETDTTLAVSGAPADAAETGRQFGLIKADLGDLSTLETHTKSDLVAAINEAAQSGLSNTAKEALLVCFDNVAWKGTSGAGFKEALYDALYPNRYPTVIWDKSAGRLPSLEDGITTYNNSENIFAAFDSQNGIYINHNNSAVDSQYIIYAPTEYNTCEKGVFEVSISVSADNDGEIDIRLSDGTSGMRSIVKRNEKMAILDGSDSVELSDVEFSTGEIHNIKYEFDKNGTNRITMDGVLIYEGSEVATQYASANRFFLKGKAKCYIQSMKWTIKEE